jgi:hypothetical protein
LSCAAREAREARVIASLFLSPVERAPEPTSARLQTNPTDCLSECNG